MLAMEESAVTNPNKKFEIKKVLEDQDIVVTYSQVQKKEGDVDIAVVHMFRFEGDRIVEMWDVGQVIPRDSPNENGMF